MAKGVQEARAKVRQALGPAAPKASEIEAKRLSAAAGASRFEISASRDGYAWHLVSGERVLLASDFYSSRGSAVRASEGAREILSTALRAPASECWEWIEEGEGQPWRWRLKAANGHTVAVSLSLTNEAARKESVELAMHQASLAPTLDAT